MKIVSKKEADQLLKNNPHLKTSVFCTGKYEKTPKNIIGVEVIQLKGVHAVYGVRRSYKHGQYTKLMCICG
jgi:hypothetical protein